MQLVSTCIKCGLTIDAQNGKCPHCSDKLAQAGSDSKLSIKKIIKHPLIKYTLITLTAMILLGFSLQLIIPDCHCSLEACNGCGGLIGNFLGRFSISCIAISLMGSVLLIWFGIPVLILWLVLSGVFRLFNKSNNNE